MKGGDKTVAVGRTRRLLPGEVLFSKGEPARETYLVLQGKIRLVENRFSTDERDAIVVETGGFVGESALLDGGPRERTAMAAESSVVLCIGPGDLRALVKEQPALAERILRHLRDARERAGGGQAGGSRRRSRPQESGENFFPLLRFDEGSPYLFIRSLTCPVCKAEFEVEAVRMSRLTVEARYPDFRVKYRGIEPLWYRYSVCPRCLLSGKQAEFKGALSEKAVQALADDTHNRKTKFGVFDFRLPRDQSLAVTSTRLAEQCYEVAGRPAMDRALAALHALWLYEDIGDKKQARAAMARAADLYVQAYNELDSKDPKLEQRLAYLIGWLSHRLYRSPDAMAYMLKAAKLNPQGDRAVTEMVRDAMPAIRSRYAQKLTPEEIEKLQESS